MSTSPPTTEELARRERRSKLNKYEKLADVDKNGILNDEQMKNAMLYKTNWDRLGLATPEPSEYGDEEEATVEDAPPTTIFAAAIQPKSFMGVVLTPPKEFGTYAGKCRRWSDTEKATIKIHMKHKEHLEAKWAEKYACSAVKPKCVYV
jgi:hypothetical protein